MDEIIRSFDISDMQVLEGERAVVARVNTAAVDRLMTVIDPFGCDYSHFNKTRSVLWQHGQDPIRTTIPIGQGWVKTRSAERDMLGKTTFRKDEFSQSLFDAYKDGSIRGWSIKAGVREASPPTQAEMRARPELESCEMIYRKWDLIEYSATPTPGNSDCLTLLVSRGLITAPEGFVAVEPAKEPEPQTGIYIREADGQWHVMDGERRIISAPTKALAEECVESMAIKPSASLEARLSGSLSQIRSMGSEISRDVQEYIDLYRWGRI